MLKKAKDQATGAVPVLASTTPLAKDLVSCFFYTIFYLIKF
jgi:hypothetical protein